jgi:hypothetical protein
MPSRYSKAILRDEEAAVNERSKPDQAPPAVISRNPGRALERKLHRRPHDKDAQVDVGSDESMDASDPVSAVHPGSSDRPAPSSGFPEDYSDE